jgi:hypothetical protein
MMLEVELTKIPALGIPAQRQILIEHPLFDRIRNFSQMRRFMEAHVFAVWDFMSLLKTLQRQLTTTQVPWVPPRNREAARFINEIVVGEESDEVVPGQYISHFELYLEAMKECGASTLSIDCFVTSVARGNTVEESLSAAVVPAYVRAFVRSTLNFCTLEAHETAAAFLYGREEIIPEMFQRVLDGSPESADFGKLKLYLNRHIGLDGESHGPMAKKMMRSLCGNDMKMWQEAGKTAHAALAARQNLWNGLLNDLE